MEALEPKEGEGMREIKFRGKSLRTGKWVYGSLVRYGDGRVEIYTLINPRDENSLRAWLEEVDSATVGQFTGLRDKNDREIYEGDIVTWDDRSNGKYWRVAQVYYDKFGRLCYKFTHKTTTTDLIGSIWYQGQFAYAETTHIDLEIIGNIHENPELLGGSECEVFKGLNR